MGDPYNNTVRHKCAVNLLPDESFYNLQSMLFNSANMMEILEFIMKVKEFSAEYRVTVSACS